MTESKEPEKCSAQLRFPPRGPYPCTLDTGHVGLHRDADGDEWEITWSSEPTPAASADRWTELYERHGSNRDSMTLALFDGLGELEKRMTALEVRISEGLSSLTRRMDALEPDSEDLGPVPELDFPV